MCRRVANEIAAVYAARMSRAVEFPPTGVAAAAAVVVALLAGPGSGETARASAATASDAFATRPNILLLVAEDMSARVGAFGDPVARTPNLDRLASQGVRFPNTFTTAGVCAPSRAALMLGMHAISTGTQHMRTASAPAGRYLAVPPAHAKAFPELLRRAGYFTYQHGKLDYQFSETGSGSGPPSIWDAEDNDDQWADREAGQPFFGMINYLVTHESGMFAPLGTAPRNLVHFFMQAFQTYQRWGWSDRIEGTDPATVVLPPYYPDLPEIRTDLARHYDNIQIMDAQVGELIGRLERAGLAESTIIIWTSDHGDGLPRAKRDLFDAGIRVPLIVRWPERWRPATFTPGALDARLISMIDLSAAILGLANTPVPAHFQGRDFLAAARRPDQNERAERTFVFASKDRIDDTTDRQRAVRDRRFKYIRSFHPELVAADASAFRENLRSMRALRRAYHAGRLDRAQRAFFEAPGEERLFDLTNDPDELNDVSGNPTYRTQLERMRAAYDEFRVRVPDWSDVPEAEMAARFWPDGRQPETPAPVIAVERERIVIHSPTEHASIEYRLDDGPWRLYADAIPVSTATRRVAARAVRYGWATSDEVSRRLPR